MGDKSCRTCMVFKQGDCLGQKICEFYRPIPSSEGIEYWRLELGATWLFCHFHYRLYKMIYVFHERTILSFKLISNSIKWKEVSFI